MGVGALGGNTTGAQNTAVGYSAGYSNVSSNNNVFFGDRAGYSNTGAQNAFIGQYSGYSATSGTYNTFVGAGAGYLVTSGGKNTIIGGYNGNQGVLDIRTASNYIVLSDGDGNPRGLFDNNGSYVIGANSPDSGTSSAYYSGFGFVNKGTANNYMVVGHPTGTSSGNGFHVFAYNGSIIGSVTQNGTTGVLYNLTSDYRLKNNQEALTDAKDFIMALKPKKWQWWDGSGEGVGFVAHEFMEVAKYSGHGEKDAIDENGKPVYQSIQPSSSEVMANLVAFIQEQQALITQLTTRLTALENK